MERTPGASSSFCVHAKNRQISVSRLRSVGSQFGTHIHTFGSRTIWHTCIYEALSFLTCLRCWHKSDDTWVCHLLVTDSKTLLPLCHICQWIVIEHQYCACHTTCFLPLGVYNHLQFTQGECFCWLCYWHSDSYNRNTTKVIVQPPTRCRFHTCTFQSYALPPIPPLLIHTR